MSTVKKAAFWAPAASRTREGNRGSIEGPVTADVKLTRGDHWDAKDSTDAEAPDMAALQRDQAAMLTCLSREGKIVLL